MTGCSPQTQMTPFGAPNCIIVVCHILTFFTFSQGSSALRINNIVLFKEWNGMRKLAGHDCDFILTLGEGKDVPRIYIASFLPRYLSGYNIFIYCNNL